MKADRKLVEGWRANPQKEAAVVIHVDGSAEAYRDAVADLGMTIRHVFKLTNTIAAYGRAQHALELIEKPWVKKVETDQQITTMV